MTVLRRDECEKCGSEMDSLARPGECADEGCRGRMVVVEYVRAAGRAEAVERLLSDDEAMRRAVRAHERSPVGGRTAMARAIRAAFEVPS